LSNRKEKNLVIEGDYGALVSLVAPARMIKCDQNTLQRLGYDLEAQGGGEETAKREYSYFVNFDFYYLGEKVEVSKNDWENGVATEGIWLSEFAEHLRPYVEAVLSGKAKTIDEARKALNS
jgi:hypothetical protein